MPSPPHSNLGALNQADYRLTNESKPSTLSVLIVEDILISRKLLLSQIVGRHDVADSDYIQFLAEQALLDECAENEAADAAETIDCYFDSHIMCGLKDGKSLH